MNTILTILSDVYNYKKVKHVYTKSILEKINELCNFDEIKQFRNWLDDYKQDEKFQTFYNVYNKYFYLYSSADKDKAIKDTDNNAIIEYENLHLLIENLTKENHTDESSEDELFTNNSKYLPTNVKAKKNKKNIEFNIRMKKDGVNQVWNSDTGNPGKYYIDIKISRNITQIKSVEKEDRWKYSDVLIKGCVGSYIDKNNEGNLLIKNLTEHCLSIANKLPDLEYKENKSYEKQTNQFKKKKTF